MCKQKEIHQKTTSKHTDKGDSDRSTQQRGNANEEICMKNCSELEIFLYLD